MEMDLEALYHGNGGKKLKTSIKLFLFELLLCIISYNSFSQKVDRRDINTYFSSGLFIKEDTTIQSDSIIVIDNDDDTSFVTVKKLNIALLEIRIYNKFKNLIETFRTWKGEKEGEHFVYYKSGKIENMSFYHNGQLISPKIGYFESGKLESIYNEKIIPDVSSFKRSGNYIVYYENGNVKMEAFYSDISDSCTVFNYYESGKLKAKCFGLTNNQRYFEFYETGKTKTEGYYNMDIQFPQGEWKEYYPNGKIKALKYYEYINSASYAIGEWIYYDENGTELKRETKNNPDPIK